MASRIFESPRVDSQTLVETAVNVDVRTSRVLAAMKALSESHTVLEVVLVGAYNKVQELPLSGDQKLSILCLLLFLFYCFAIYPYFLCPTKDVPGPFFTSTAVGDRLYAYYKQSDNADQWALSLHEKHGSVVRLMPTLLSISDPTLLPNSKHIVNSSLTSPKDNEREGLLFRSVNEDVVKDLKLALNGQKTVDIHDLLSRHLQKKAPASFATALAHTIYQLAHPMHRHYLNRLVKEIQTADDDEVVVLDLLNAVVKESLRTQQAQNHHAAHFTVNNGRSVVGGYELQEGIEVVASLYCVTRNDTIFSRPGDFNPTRWLEGDKAHIRMEEALEFVLNHHRRIKPGFDTALDHLKILLATILRSFDMKLPLGEQPKQLDVVSLRNGGCRVRFRERKQGVEKKVRFAEHVVM